MSIEAITPRPAEPSGQFLTGPPPPSSHATRMPFVYALRWIVLSFAALYLAMFPLVMLPALRFDRWAGLKWVPVLDYSFTVRNADADLLIFGDSSAFLGLDPHRIERQTGLRTVILPNTIGSLPVTGEMALRAYLAHNKRPKLIVFYFVPWDLDYAADSANSHLLFEGEEMLLRHGSTAQIAGFARTHPLDLLQFPFALNSTLGPNSLAQTLRTDRGRLTAQGAGHIDYLDRYPALSPVCTLPPALLRSGTHTVEALMTRFSTPQTPLAFYLAPAPACSNADNISTPHLSFELLNRSGTLPAPWFAADGLYAHILPPYVPQATDRFIQALRSLPMLSAYPRPA